MKKLSLADWGHIAEIFGAVAVVVSLLYVGAQLKQNTAAIQAQTSQQIMSTYAETNFAIVGQESLAPLFVKVNNGEDLTPVESEKLGTWAHILFSNWEQAFRSHKNGLLEDEVWAAWDIFFRWNMEYPFVLDAWVNNPIEGYTKSFMQYVNEEVLRGETE